MEFLFNSILVFPARFSKPCSIVLFTSRDLQGFGNLAGVAIIDCVYKSNSSSIDKESDLIAVESGALIRINERAFPEI